MSIQRRNIVKWLTLIMSLIIFIVQIIRYTYDKLSDFWTEFIVASVWLLLLIAPFTIPYIIKKFINKK